MDAAMFERLMASTGDDDADGKAEAGALERARFLGEMRRECVETEEDEAEFWRGIALAADPLWEPSRSTD